MRFAVVGAGAVGGYFGARLAEAGHDVAFVARGATLQALRSDGLHVASVAGDVHVKPAAEQDPAAVGQVDVVLVAVKAWQVADVAPTLAPLLGSDTVVVPLQNGVEAAGELAASVGRERVLGGLCRILSEQVGPGRIRHSGVPPRIEIGERDRRPTDRVERLRRTLDACRGVTALAPADIEVALWEKFLFISSFSGVGAVCRAGAGEVRSLPATRDLLRGAMSEVAMLARVRDVELRDDVVDRNVAFVDGLPETAIASMHRDIVDGRPSELEQQSGAVVRLSRDAGLDAPVHGFIYAALLPQEQRARRVAPSR